MINKYPYNTEIILSGGGINWTWYAHVIILDDTFCEVTKEYRLHNFDDYQGANKHPKKEDILGYYRIKENSLDDSRIQGRIALGVEINDVLYRFKEPISRWDVGKPKYIPQDLPEHGMSKEDARQALLREAVCWQWNAAQEYRLAFRERERYLEGEISNLRGYEHRMMLAASFQRDAMLILTALI